MYTKRMIVAVVALCALFVSVWMLPDAAASEGIREPAKPLAEMAVGGGQVNWQPAGDYEHLTLTVAGPAGIRICKEFEAGQPAFLSLFGQNGQALPNGAYAYELRLVSRKEGNLPERSLLQAGSFAVRDGSFAAAFEEIEPPTRKAPAETRVMSNELVTAANACIGSLCVAGDDAGPPILRLKDYWGVGIWFNDTPDSFSHSRDWLLQANPNPFSGGLQHFFLQDMDAGTIPFSVQGQAPDYSLVVGGDSVVGSTGGNIGVGTALPAKAVHIARTDTPTLRFEDTYTGTFPGIRIWDLGANATELFIKDVTGSSSVPFRILAGAPTDSLRISSTGLVGIGTASPSTQLHVRNTGSGGKILAENASGTTTPRELLEIRNNGGTVLILDDTSVAERWAIGTVGSSIAMDNQANAGLELTLSNTGNLTVAGTVTPGSSRTIKEEFSAVDSRAMLRRVLDLPITTWSYKATPGVRHVGPMSEDFFAAFAVGSDDKGISVTDSAGVALAAIQGLSHQVADVTTQKNEEIAQLRRENADLAQRLAALEALVLQGRADQSAALVVQPAP